MKTSEAKRKANKKWDSKFDNIRIRVKKGDKAIIQEYCKKQGMSVNAFINKTIFEVIIKGKKERN